MRTTIPKSKFRTGIANGSRILDGVDGRSHVVRRFREIGAALARDACPHGDPPEALAQLIRSAAGLVILRESLDVEAANDRKIDVAEYCTISNALRRMLLSIGLARVPHAVTQYDETRELWATAVAELDAEAAAQ
jgi:hypothetical protein